MLKTLPFLAAICCTFLSFAKPSTVPGYHFLQEKEIEEIPMKIINNLPVIEVILNDEVKLNLILDTGIRSTVIFSKSYVKELDYKPGREVHFSGLGQKNLLKGKIWSGVKVNIGNYVQGNQISMVVVHDNHKLKRQFANKNIHGVIGYELFVRFVVEIDYHNKMVSLLERGYFDFEDVYQSIPIHIKDTKPYITADLQMGDAIWKNALLLLDTGSGTTLLLNNSNLLKMSDPEAVAAGLSGNIKGEQAQMDQISFKDFQLKKVPFYIIEKQPFAERINNCNRIGTVGGGLFSAFAIVFDYSKSLLYVRRTHPSNHRTIVDL